MIVESKIRLPASEVILAGIQRLCRNQRLLGIDNSSNYFERLQERQILTLARLTLIGIYTVDNHSDVHLIEMLFDDAPENVEVGEITQEIDGQLRDTWQAVYDEKYLDATGTTIIGDDIDLPKGELRTRLIFFFHFLDFKKPLLTPYGELKLTAPTAMPSRLAGKLEYEKP